MLQRSVYYYALVLLLLGLNVSYGHNYLGVPSRARLASVQAPCQARINPEPHVQVIPGQDFHVEWSLGHGDSRTKTFYFVVVHASDYDSLNLATESLLDDYIANAPLSAYFTGEKYEKRHLSAKTSSITGLSSSLNPNRCYLEDYFEKVINESDPMYFVRNSVAVGRDKIPNTGDFLQVKYKDFCNDKDASVSYFNPKYPWIESVFRYYHMLPVHRPFAHELDVALIRITARKGPGDYVVNFRWGGYFDCIDVNVQDRSTPISAPFGAAVTSTDYEYAKLHHAEFAFMKNPATPCRIAPQGNASVCLEECRSLSNCTGVQVVRAFNPANTMNYTVNIPTKLWTAPAVDGVATTSCQQYANSLRTNCSEPQPMCDISSSGLNPAANDFICYGLTPYVRTTLEVQESYVFATEPTDPKYYSTVYTKIAKVGYLAGSQAPVFPVTWNAGDKCLNCTFLANVKKLPFSMVPDWASGFNEGACINCDTVDQNLL